MNRSYLIEYLEGEGCFTEEEGCEVSQVWRNCINGNWCEIPCDEDLDTMAYGHIIYTLKIDPPVEFDSEYYVYASFKEFAQKD